MKKYFSLLALSLILADTSYAAKQVLKDNATPTDRGSINTNAARSNANFTELYDGKADKAASIRYWTDWPTSAPNNVLAINTIVAFDGKFYKVIQQITKTGSTADPETLTAYFEEVGKVTAASLGLGTADNPSFNSVHASGGNLAAANKQVTKAWQSGLSYTADVTSVIHGGKHWIAKTTHTAGSTTEPGVGASYTNAWTEVSGAGDDLGDAAYSDVVALWTTCTGYLKSDGTCDTPSGSMTYPGAGIPNSTGSAWGTSYTVGTGPNNLIALNSSGELPFDIPSKANVSCFASESAFNACFDLTWASRSTPPSGTGIVVVSSGAYGTPLTLDTDLASVSASDDSVASAKATKAAIDAVTLGGVTVQADDPTSASAAGWYAATGSGDIFYKSASGLFTIAGSYVADPVTPTLSSRTIGTNGTTLTLVGSASLSIGAGGNGGFDVDCVTAGNNITATYASGAPGTDLVYTLGTTVNSGDTCDLDYTQPGNGIEATTGGADIASITSASITNNSTQSAASYNDITLWWRAESATLSTGDYSGGDTSVSLTDGAAVNSSAMIIGTNGLDIPAAWGAAHLAISSSDIINEHQFRIGFHYRCTARGNGAGLFSVYNGSGHFIRLLTAYTDELILRTNTGSDNDIATTDLNLTCNGTDSHFIEVVYDDVNNTRAIIVDGTAAVSSSAAFSGIDNATKLIIGSGVGGVIDAHIDNVMISDSPSTRNFYSDTSGGTTLRNLTSSPR